jgi:hypothetical protein
VGTSERAEPTEESAHIIHGFSDGLKGTRLAWNVNSQTPPQPKLELLASGD